MRTCLLQITGYKQLYHDVENVRKKPYDSGNVQHEKLLLKVRAGSGFRESASAVRAVWILEVHVVHPFACLLENVLDFIGRERLLVKNSYLISIF